MERADEDPGRGDVLSDETEEDKGGAEERFRDGE
jgi:hypothetical protein